MLVDAWHVLRSDSEEGCDIGSLSSIKSLEKGDEAKGEPTNTSFPHGNNHIFDNDNEDYNSDEGEEPSEDEAAMDYPGQYTQSLGWGSGQQLNGPVKKAATESSKNASEPDRREVIQRFPINNPCRLRIRLPGSTNESVLEEFDSNEKLAVVYTCVKSHIPSSSSESAASPRLGGGYDTHWALALATRIKLVSFRFLGYICLFVSCF